MGDRAQVHIADTGVWLYAHWNAYNLIETVQRALAKRWRWTDPEYLARIVFCEMCREEPLAELGYGIGRGQHGDVHRVVEIECKEQTVTIINGDSDAWMESAKEKGFKYNEPQNVWRGSMEEFINANADEFSFYPPDKE